MSLQPVRGTRDLRGAELQSFIKIIRTARQVASLYQFEEIETPIFEFTDVFKRTLGDVSDIVTKEMYTFEDRSGDMITLRPEGTASIARSVISNQMFRDLPLKYFYQGPMFRHERPQKGRFRQFYQMGVELIGVASPVADAEIISMGWSILKALGLEKNITLELNSLGDKESRDNYRKELVKYFNKHRTQLSEDSQTRLEKNPLRILDSKSEQDQKIVDGAPFAHDFFTKEAKEFFAQLCKHLQAIGIPYELNSKLVRGLDYYGHTVFEFTTTDLGAQNAVLSGGRYDQLIETMGSQSTPGVGWAAGIDRLSLLYKLSEQPKALVGVVPFSSENESEALRLLELLHSNNTRATMPYSGNLSKRLKKLSRLNCTVVIIVGGEEEAKNQVQIKDMTKGEQAAINKDQVLNYIDSHFPSVKLFPRGAKK